MIWTFLLLLLAGGMVWVLWPKSDGILYAYVPAETDILVSVNTTEWAKILAKEKIQHGDRLDSLFTKIEKRFGIDFTAEESGFRGTEAIDFWEAPLLAIESGAFRKNTLLLAVKDSAALEELLENRLGGDGPAIRDGEGFRYVFDPAGFSNLLAWNANTLAMMTGDRREILLDKARQIFAQGKSGHYTFPHKLSHEKSELAIWISPAYLALDEGIFDKFLAQIRVQDEEIKVKFELTGREDFSGWSKGYFSKSLNSSGYPATLQLAIDPQKIPGYKRPDMDIREELDAIQGIMTGQLAAAVMDTCSRVSSIVTYEYDDNFERVPVTKSIRKKGLKWMGSLAAGSYGHASALLDSLEDRAVLQRKGNFRKLVDVLGQEVFVSHEGKAGAAPSYVVLHPDTSGSVERLPDFIGGMEARPQRWVEGEISEEFWPLLASAFGQEWMKWEGTEVVFEGEAKNGEINLEVQLQPNGAMSAFLWLGKFL